MNRYAQAKIQTKQYDNDWTTVYFIYLIVSSINSTDDMVITDKVTQYLCTQTVTNYDQVFFKG